MKYRFLIVCCLLALGLQSWADTGKWVPKAGNLKPAIARLDRGTDSRGPVRARRAVNDADKSLFDGRTIYGALVSSNKWDGLWLTEVPYGVYSFVIGDNPDPQVHMSDMTYCFKSAAWGRDCHYGVAVMSMMGVITGARHIQLDTKNWEETSNIVHTSDEGTYSLVPCSMAYDATENAFYAFRYKEDLSGLDWVKVNTETGDYDMIAAYRGKTVVLTLAATPDGSMYYIDTEGDLYTINKKNGRTSLVGNTGVSPAAYDQCMVYDNRSGSFLWAALSSEGSVLYSVNPETAETTRIMKFKNDEEFVSLYITDSLAGDGAPAAVGRPQLKFSGNGELDGIISLTMPSKTFGGQALSGALGLNVWLDGENLKGNTEDAGASVSIPVNLQEGNHYVAITAQNDAGFSPLRQIFQYAGYDYPLAPGGAKFEWKDDVNSVSWQVPEGGVNKGYVDFDNLYYDVVRMPDNVKVAEHLKVTSFSEPTPMALQSYYYRITAVNNSHVSAVAETNRLLCGDAFPVPYKQSFEEEATFNDFFTAIDNDGDGHTWRYGYSGEIRNDYIKNAENPIDADDWLILPKISMREGLKYRFTMNMKIFTRNYPEDFDIMISTTPEDLESFRVVKSERGFTEIASEFGDYTCDFLVDGSADYTLAIRYCSTADSNSSLMMIRSVAVDVVGAAEAPAQVGNLVVTADADDRLVANISFTAPVKNLVDNELDEISQIVVLRDDEQIPVHVFSEVTPGQEISWTDENVPSVGLHSYTITAENQAGAGEPTRAEQFVGIYAAPFTHDFDDKKLSRYLWTQEFTFDDDENDWYGWRWTENEAYGRYYSLYYFLSKDVPTEIWLFSPRFKFDENTVYTISYDGSFTGGETYPDMQWQLARGPQPTAGQMSHLEDLEAGTYGFQKYEHMIVNREAARDYLAFGVSGGKTYDYFGANFDNFALTRRASALAPFAMSDYKGAADQSGELKATLEFKTPTVNYYDEKLDANEPLTVKIYQGQNATIPAYTTQAAPGEKVQWTDEKALHGFNYYRITCENSNGPGEPLVDNIFVGRDVPELVTYLTLKGDSDNANVRLSWEKPEVGENGGLVLDAETKYNIYSYDPVSGELSAIAENLADKSYLVEKNATGAQELCYYAVAAVNTEGEGKALASSIVLGMPYALPFNESFAGSALQTQVWQAIPMIQGATSAGLDNPNGSYNGCTGPQDADGGCVYFYNGMQQELMAGALLVSPKIRVATSGNELHFWAYHYKEQAYSTNGTLTIAASADDGAVEILKTFEIGGEKEEGWKEHVMKLDRYKNANYISLVFMGQTPGYQDVIYMDNVMLQSTASGMETLAADDEQGVSPMFDLRGIRLSPQSVAPGTIIISNGRKVIFK